MVIVPSFAQSQNGHGQIFRRIDVLIVRPLAPQVSGGIDEPSGVEGQNVSEKVDAERVEEGFVPEVHRHGCWPHEAN